MEGLLKDLQFALRSLAKRPALFAVATLSLALGISANTVIFAAIDAYLIRPLPYPKPDQLVQLWTTNLTRGWRRVTTSPPDFADLRAASRTTEIAALTGGSYNLSGGDRPERLVGSRVSANFFDVMGVRPVVGRTFASEDEQTGAGRSVVLSHAFWQRRFAASRTIVGQTLLLDGAPYTVVGIMPKEFKFPSTGIDVWTPLVRSGSESRDARYLQLYGRVKDGVTLDGARTELASIMKRLAEQFPENTGNGVNVLQLHRAIYNEQFHRGATISMVAVVFVLLIACANVANLLLARATGRARELALRTALGAARGRLLQQLLTESVVLALAGGILGVVLSIWGVKAFVSIIPPDFARTETIALDARALLFTLGVSLAAGIVFGLAPALHGTSDNLNGALREGGRGATMGSRRNRLGAMLVVAEISLALVLLISAGLLIKGSILMQRVDLGFSPDGVLTTRVSLPESQYPDSARVIAFHDQLLARLRQTPGVDAAGATSDLPFEGGSGTTYSIDGAPKPEAGKEPFAEFKAIAPGYLDAMRLRLLSGRDFAGQDRLGSPLVVLASETFVKKHWPNGNAIGQRVILGANPTPREIVGIVHDSRDNGPDDEPPMMLYVPALQRASRNLAYTVRSSMAPSTLTATVRDVLAKVDPTLPLYSVRTMSEVMEIERRGEQIMPRLLGVFGAVALLLAIMGVYGVMSYSVSQRTQEMGVRMALGAQRTDILRLVLRQGGLLTLIGMIVGLALSAGATRALSFFLFGVSAYDPLIFGGVTASLTAAALLATFIPARRAVRVDPLVALRND